MLTTFVLAALLSSPQVDPCAQAAQMIVAQPGQVFTLAQYLPEHTAVRPAGGVGAGEPLVTHYETAFFVAAQTGKPVGAVAVVAKTAFTAAPPGVNCYTFSSPPVPPLTEGVEYAIGVRAKRASTATVPAGDGPWSFSVNPFVLAPSAPGALGRLVILK